MDKRKLPMSEEHKRKISESQKGKPRLYALGNKYNIGRIPWNKGKKSDISAWNKGLKICLNTGVTHIKKGQHLSIKTQFGNKEPWNKGKENPYFKGENNPRWKGGITSENHRIRASVEYRDWRTKIFQRDDYICQECGIKGGWHKELNKKIILNADHIKPFALYPELRFDVDNGRTLCINCHRKTNTYGVNFIRYNLSFKLNY